MVNCIHAEYDLLSPSNFFLGCFLAACISLSSCTTHPQSKIQNLAVNQAPLSEVIEILQEEVVEGYVVFQWNTLQWPSAAEARNDTSSNKSLFRIEVDHFRLHTPLEVEIPGVYNWGSPLICRKVVKDHGDVVELLSLDDHEEVPAKLGHGGLGADYLHELTTFVRKKDLVPVIKEPCSFVFEDSTGISFTPGAAVGIPWHMDASLRAISIQQMHFEFGIPDSLLGLSYEPIIQSQSDIENELMLDETGDLILNGNLFTPVSEVRSSRLRTPIEIREKGDSRWVVLEDQGIRMTLKTSLPLVASYYPSTDSPQMSPAFDTPPRWYYRIDEGTDVYWESGELAGHVRQYFGYASTVGPEGEMWCEFHRELLRNVPICFKIEDIEVIDNSED